MKKVVLQIYEDQCRPHNIKKWDSEEGMTLSKGKCHVNVDKVQIKSCNCALSFDNRTLACLAHASRPSCLIGIDEYRLPRSRRRG